jgi:hypothetical protein
MEKMWLHQEGKQCKQASEFVQDARVEPNLTAEDVLLAAKTFSPTTSRTDGIPPKAVALLSAGLLERLAEIGNIWIASAAWPNTEQAVPIVLPPKPTRGERPLGLFRA